MKITTIALAALLAAPIMASADTDKSKTTDKTSETNSNVVSNKPKTPMAKEKLITGDLQVMSEMHHVNQMEIDMGKVAQTKGSTQGVKAYGQMLVRDHQSADKDLLALARKHGQAIPMFKPTTEADQKDAKDDKDMAAHVKTLKGADFDKDFLSMMVAGHEKVLAKLDSAEGSVTSDELKTLITNVKPTIQKHADQARDLQKANPQAMR